MEGTTMAQTNTELPKKTREQQCVVWDSARLNDFRFRPDDIMICTWSKTGTTWMQQLIGQLLFNGDPELFGTSMSVWPEFRLLPKEQWFAMAEAQTHRRYIKTHSPLHALPFDPKIKYVYIGRDVRDVIWSMYHHQSSFTAAAYEAFNAVPDRIGSPLAPHNCDITNYYHTFLDHNIARGLTDDTEFWTHVQEFWNVRHLPNVLLVHFANLKSDFKGEAQRIARFLDIKVDDSLWPQIVGNCSLEHMRMLAKKNEMLDVIFEGGGNSFFNKGTNGRWKEVLTPAEIAKADEVAAQNLTPDCAHWLKTGALPA
jgi:aryl sulfotransferase